MLQYSEGNFKMANYNESLIDNATGLGGLYAALNDASGMVLSMMILAVLAIIVFIATKQYYDTKTAFLSASFLTTIIGVFFFAAGFITIYILLFPIVLLLFSVMAIVFVGG